MSVYTIKIHLSSGVTLGISGVENAAANSIMDSLQNLGDEVLNIEAGDGGRTIVMGRHLAGAEMIPRSQSAGAADEDIRQMLEGAWKAGQDATVNAVIHDKPEPVNPYRIQA